MKTVIFVEHGGQNKEFTLEKAYNLSFRIIIATTSPSDMLLKYVNKKDIIVTDTFDSNVLIRDVKKHIKENNIKPSIVITFKESSVISTAKLANSLGLKGVGVKAAKHSSQNKYNMRIKLKNNGFKNQPDFKLLNLKSKDILNRLNEVPKPYVIKPISGSSSIGVRKISNNLNLKEDILFISKSINLKYRETFKNFNGDVLVESYISGDIISVDGIVSDSIPIILGNVQFIMGSEPNFRQVGSFIPPKVPLRIIEECNKLTKDVIKILEFENCGFHAEWKVTKDKPMLLEIAARTVGGGILLGYQKVTGVDLIKELFKTLIGEENIFFVPEAKMCVLHKSVSFEGVESEKLLYIKGLQKVKKQKDVWDLIQYLKKGDILEEFPSSKNQLYYYALSANTIEELFLRSIQIEKMIDYELSK